MRSIFAMGCVCISVMGIFTLNARAQTVETSPSIPPAAPVYTAAPLLSVPPSASAPVGTVPAIEGESPVGRPVVTGLSEQQVRANLMSQGYFSATGLAMDGTGTWRGTATKNGANVAVSIDSQGIITPP